MTHANMVLSVGILPTGVLELAGKGHFPVCQPWPAPAQVNLPGLKSRQDKTTCWAVSRDSLNKQRETVRPLSNFPRTIWDDHFNFFTLNKQVYEMYSGEIELLKGEVSSILKATENSMTNKLILIDIIERLSISHHFEEEIDKQLEAIFHQNANLKEPPKCDLRVAALQFRLLREHGFDISCGIFYQFMDDHSKFKESLKNDTRGLLNLYEAAQLRTHRDVILEEALNFATSHLKFGTLNTSSTLAQEITHALDQPFHKSIRRVEARHYISIYDKYEHKIESLSRLAKLDYNFLQMLHKQELDEILRWGKTLDWGSKLSYRRERFVECYFWALGIFYEPQYSSARILFTKSVVLCVALDDTFDAYGTLDELRSMKEAVERCDGTEINRLPDNMKPWYLALLDLSQKLDEQLTKQGRTYALYKYKEENTCGVTTRRQSGEIPALADYSSNALFTSGYFIVTTSIFLAVKSATKEVFDWYSRKSEIHVAAAKLCRLINDVASYKKERGTSVGIECYMKNYNVSEEEAKKKLMEMVEDAWKDINEEYLKAIVPREIRLRVLNLVRTMEVFYKYYEDGLSDPQKVLKSNIIAMLVDPINV